MTESFESVRRRNQRRDAEQALKRRNEARALLVECPKCGALPKANCRRQGLREGRFINALLSRPHRERIEAANATGTDQ